MDDEAGVGLKLRSNLARYTGAVKAFAQAGRLEDLITTNNRDL